MVRKPPLVTRILLLSLLYFVVFFTITLIQFTGPKRTVEPAVVVVVEEKKFDPADFTIREASSDADFNAIISSWQEESYRLWNRTFSTHNDEDLVIGFLTEALVRGSYSAALSAIPPGFLNGNRRTYESSVYLGRLDQSARTLIAQDREKFNRIARLIQENSLEILNEDKIFEFLYTRGYTNYIEAVGDVIRSLDPDSIELTQCPGIFEGYNDWNRYGFTGENPFTEQLIDQACTIISNSLWMNEEKTVVFVIENGEDMDKPEFNKDFVDIEFNLRLGLGLLDCANSAGDEGWAALARSIVLSALYGEEQVTDALASARLYRMMEQGEYSPRAVTLGPRANNIWVYTAARTISASIQNDVLDINVNFPVGESHYIIVRGIGPFSRLQFYQTDWRTDPQFERYDSSGWSYISSEQTLLIKMRHRTAEEHILIYF